MVLLLLSCGSEVCFDTSVTARLVAAFMSPSETLRQPSRSYRKKITYNEWPGESSGKERSAKLPLSCVEVNLWKTPKVSYLQLDSYSTSRCFNFSVRDCQNGPRADA